MVEGILREGEVIHVVVKTCHDLTKFLSGLVKFLDE
jgi:hypothetical protein